MSLKPSLCLCMIVKNEEAYLAQCIDSVADIVDEIVIVDTGSTDKTIDIAKSYHAKVFHLNWNDDFSYARNFALSHSTSDWLLLLDADEKLDSNYKDKLVEFITFSDADGAYFLMHNYLSQKDESNFNIHYPLRLLRNHRGYSFKGAIHEQLSHASGQVNTSNFTSEDILLHHYGYLDQVESKQDKRTRNIPILLKQLENDPTNAFVLFNLGNEYMVLADYPKSIELYEKALLYAIPTHASTPHLYHRLISALSITGNDKRALLKCDEALRLYPECTDIQYFKGIIHYSLHQYTLAINTLNHCLELVSPPAFLKFTDGCSTYKPHIALAKIYTHLGDFDQALDAYAHALNLNPSLFTLVYDIGNVLDKKLTDKDVIPSTLKKFFSSLDYVPNLVVFIDILLINKLYLQAKPFLDQLQKLVPDSGDFLYLYATYTFYTRQYKLSSSSLNQLLNSSISTTTLPDIKEKALIILFSIGVLENNILSDTLLHLLNTLESTLIKNILLQFTCIYNQETTLHLTADFTPSQYLYWIMYYLDNLLRIQVFDLFEKSLYILNYVDSDCVLIELAKLYSNNGLQSMCVKTLFQSIKNFDSLPKDAAYLLYQNL